MENKMWPIEVTKTEQGYIRISQDVGSFDEEESIMLHPDQIDLLVKWLNKAKDELQNL